MLAKYKDVQTFSSENGHKKAFLKCFLSGAYLEKFLKRLSNFVSFSSIVFFSKVEFKQLK